MDQRNEVPHHRGGKAQFGGILFQGRDGIFGVFQTLGKIVIRLVLLQVEYRRLHAIGMDFSLPAVTGTFAASVLAMVVGARDIVVVRRVVQVCRHTSVS